MAKAGFWMQGAKGKLVNAVFQKGRNGTIQRQLVTPKNPKTDAQIVARAIFATVSQAAAALSELITQSFEGLDPVEARTEFVRRNIKMLKSEYIAGRGAYTAPGMSHLVTNNYQISQGSLPGTALTRLGFLNELWEIKVPLAGTPESPTVTKKDFLEAMFGTSEIGAQVTLITLEQKYTEDVHIKDGVYASTQYSWKAERMVIDDNEGSFSVAPNAGIDFTAMFRGDVDIMNVFEDCSIKYAGDGRIEFNPLPSRYSMDFGARAVIVSKQVNGVWKYTTSSLFSNTTDSEDIIASNLIEAWRNANSLSEGNFLEQGGSSDEIPV